ncbi:hypothetical protein FQR65_LT16092 [Abscondita terminalis]|nr:hypothetical protein FQR65_LT16092 [Abscondita terminalis]
MSRLSLKKNPPQKKKVTILSDVVIQQPFQLHEMFPHEDQQFPMMENIGENSSSCLYPQQSLYEMITPPPQPLIPVNQPENVIDQPQEIIDLDSFPTPNHVPDFNVNASSSKNEIRPIGKSWRKLKEVCHKSSDEEDELEKDEEEEVAGIKARYRDEIIKKIEEKWDEIEDYKSRYIANQNETATILINFQYE